MSYNYGQRVRVSVFGASHAPFVGVTVEGLPAGEPVDLEALRAFLRRRAPGQNAWSSARRESDEPELCGGLVDGVTDGTPLTVMIKNNDVRPADYAALRDVPRPGHADYPARVKYGAAAELDGGGAFSGRMTAPLCAAGGICLQLLARRGVRVTAHLLSVGSVSDAPFDPMGLDDVTVEALRHRELPVLSDESCAQMREEILSAAAEGDSVGGVVECLVEGLPLGLGGPLFEGLESRLAPALFAIPAVKGVSFGEGFGAAALRGSENNDPYVVRSGAVTTLTNHAGGVLGGLSTGLPLLLRAAFKPTPSIAKPQRSVRLSTLEETELRIAGRHDPCVAPRAVPVVEAVTALALLDAWPQPEVGAEPGLAALREKIDRTDAALAPLLAERMRLSDEIGALKREKDLPVRDKQREETLLRRVSVLAGEESGSVAAVYQAILAESRARQTRGEEETP